MGSKALPPVFVWPTVWCLYWPCCTQIALVYSPTFWQAGLMGDGHPGARSSHPLPVWEKEQQCRYLFSASSVKARICTIQPTGLEGCCCYQPLLELDKTLRVIPATSTTRKDFSWSYGGRLGAHLRDATIHGELSWHYWWRGVRSDIIRWCKSCLTCVSHQVGRAIKPPLTPIPVAGPFDRVGVDVIQFPKSYEGSQYGIVFVDYVTKWPEVFAAPDQTSLTIVQLLVDHVICRHGVPVQLLFDRRKAFSSLMEDIYKLMGIHKVSTTAYHPQTNGLVERFNWTWKCFCYILEVSGLIHKYNNHMIIWLALTPSSTTSAPHLDCVLPIVSFEWLSFQYFSFLSEMFLFFYVEDNGILVEYAYSFLRIIFNTAQLGFYHCTL